MGQITFDCPHVGCGTKKSAFEMVASLSIGGGQWEVMANCGSCHHSIIVRCRQETVGHALPHNFGGNIFHENFRVIGIWPEPPRIETVGALPAAVEDIFMEAEQNFADGRLRTSAMGYRATIETALKLLDPGNTGMLAARIKAMKGMLPSALIDLLDHVKFLGNGAAHDGMPDAEDVAAGRDFVRLFLVYTFELPARVAEAAAKRMLKP